MPYNGKIKAKDGYYGNIRMDSLLERHDARFFDLLKKPWKYEPHKLEIPGLATAYKPDFQVFDLLLGSDSPVYVEARPIGNPNKKAKELARQGIPVLLLYGRPSEEGSYAVFCMGDEERRVQFGCDGYLQSAAADANLLDGNVPYSIWKAAMSADAFEYEAANRKTLQALIGISPEVLGELSKPALVLLQLVGTAIREPATPQQLIDCAKEAGLEERQAVLAYQELLAKDCLVSGNQRLEQMRASKAQCMH